MFKKIIYSFMALSLTMLPATEVMGAVTLPSTGGTIESSADNVEVTTSNPWTGGLITNTGGTLTITGYSATGNTTAPNYIQSGTGALVVQGSSSAAGALTIQGSSTTAAAISGGTITLSTSTEGNAGTLTLGNYSSIGSSAKVVINPGSGLVVNGTNSTLTLGASTEWKGGLTLTEGTIDVGTNVATTKYDTGTVDTKGNPVYGYGTYDQTGGTLNVKGGTLTFDGNDNYQQTISGGSVNVDNNGTLNLGQGSAIKSGATVNIGANGTVNLTGQQSQTTPTLVLNTGDTWNGTITNGGNGLLSLQGYDNSTSSGAVTQVYQQTGGTLDITGNSDYWIKPNTISQDSQGNDTSTTNSYISSGDVYIRNGSSLNVNAATTNKGVNATLNNTATVYLNQGGTLNVSGTGTAVLNDIISTNSGSGPNENDVWSGQVIVGDGTDSPVLELQNVGIDFTNGTLSKDESVATTAVFVQKSGETYITGNANGGSNIVINNVYGANDAGTTYYNSPVAEGATTVGYHDGVMYVAGPSEATASTLTVNYLDDYTSDNFLGYWAGVVPEEDISVTDKPALVMAGNGNIVINTNGNEVDYIFDEDSNFGQAILGVNSNNNLTVNGDDTGSLFIYNTSEEGVDIGSNVTINNGTAVVVADKTKIGIYANDTDEDDVTTDYGSLTLNNSEYMTYSTQNTIVGDLTLNNSWMYFNNPSTTTVGGDLTTGSGIDMMNGGIDTISVGGNTNINDLELKIDINPVTMQYDTIVADGNVLENGPLTLSDYNLLDNHLTKTFYRFHVVQGKNGYTVGNGANKTVTGNARRVIRTIIGDYTMSASPANGAFDLALYRFNPELFRGQVAADVIYANQQVINNQLFDRMMYSILPYFNAKCANKVAAADTLYSPYQYTMMDPGLWFKPYANFETIHMNHGLTKVRNNAYGAMIGADFKKAEWGNWTFIPTAYIGYNGGHTTYSGVSMWHNGGQLGFMGTLTNGDFITMFDVYGGAYGNSMNVHGHNDKNALWNAGVGSKTAYNIHLPWDFILQPTVYMSYNYVGGSSWKSRYDDYKHKVGALNGYSIAPGLNLIWQKETFSIYALFQVMFNINSTIAGKVAEIDLPHVGIRDPYFEYGLGASKYFLDRFSGYGQVTARSGSRKGVGFQLGLNVRI